MRLCRFLEGGSARLGLVDEERVIDLSAAEPELPPEPAAALDAGGTVRLAELGAGAGPGAPFGEVD